MSPGERSRLPGSGGHGRSPWPARARRVPGKAARAGAGTGAGGGGGQRAPEAPGKGKPRHCFPPGECGASPLGTVGGFFNLGTRNAGKSTGVQARTLLGSGVAERLQPFGLDAEMRSPGRLDGYQAVQMRSSSPWQPGFQVLTDMPKSQE